MKKLIFITLTALIFLVLTGCAHVIPVNDCIPATEHIYGFWGGTWHGMITWFTFFGSLIYDDVTIYAVNNNGGWYNFGFIGGFWIILKLIGGILKRVD